MDATDHNRHLNRGQLKIVLQKLNGQLHLRVCAARHLVTNQQRSKGHIYIRACIGAAVVGQSDPVPFTAHTELKAAFVTHLKGEDEKKRLFITLWCQYGGMSAEFVGCMSFGLRHLISKLDHLTEIGGWYFLLSQHLGERKHLLAQPLEDQKGLQHASGITGSVSSVFTGTQGSEDSASSGRLRIHIPKLPTGYGFTVQGSCPVKVCHIKGSGAAAVYNVKEGDELIRINGQEVSHWDALQVATLVKNSQQLFLEIYRQSDEPRPNPFSAKRSNTYESLQQAVSPKVGCLLLKQKKSKKKHTKKKKSLNCVFGCGSKNAYKTFCDENQPPHPSNNSLLERFLKQSVEMTTPREQSIHLTTSQIDLSHASTSLLINSKQYSPKSRTRFSVAGTESPSEFLRSSMPRTGDDIHRWLDAVSSETDSLLRKDGSYSNSSPEISPNQTIAPSTSLLPSPEVTRDNDSLRQRLISEDNLKWDPGISMIHGSESSTRSRDSSAEFQENDSAFTELDNAYISGPLHSQFLHTTLVEESTFSPEQSVNHTLPVTEASSISDQEESVDLEEVDIIEGLDRLVDCEMNYMKQMQWGIERFSRPLRHALLTSEQHKTLFQNIEKLVTLSRYHLQQLNSLPELQLEDHSVCLIAAVYKPRLRVLCEGYDNYFCGYSDSFSLLRNLTDSNREFASFVQLRSDEHSEMNIEQFIMKPLEHLHDLVSTLKSLMPDLLDENLSSELHSFGCVIEDLEFIWNKWRPMEERLRPVSMTPRVRGHPSPKEPEVDPQLLSLSSRLQGADNLQLASTHRHVLFSSEMIIGENVSMVTAWLLSDMLLFTQSGDGDSLLLVRPPLLLSEVVSCEPGPIQSCDLMLYHQAASATSDHNGFPLSRLHMRTLNPEFRHAWSSIIEHRLSSVHNKNS